MPLTFLLCCCGCGIPLKDIWNYSRQLPQDIAHGIRRKAKARKDRKYYRDLVAGLNTPIRRPTAGIQSRDNEQLQSCLFRLPLQVRLQIWEYCIGQRFIYAPIYNRSRPHFVARVASYREPWPLEIYTRPHSEFADTLSSAWRPLDMILLPDIPTEPELIEPKQSVAFGSVGAFLTEEQTTSLSRKWKSSELLLSCKAVHAEAAHVLFSHNAFSFTYLPHLSAFRLHQGPCWRYLRFLHLDLILGPSVNIPGVVDRAAWRALWTMMSRESTGLQMLGVGIHVPMNHTIERWLTYRGEGWSARDRFFQGLPTWADDLTVVQDIRHARFEVDAERLGEFRDYTSWPYASSVLKFRERVAHEQQRMTGASDSLLSI
ncbi:uncharacterized protein FMAN_14381 [Fusarium mangiferae]|uniref:Uncharacterized protein n=1 Tax=Fusarium mangiferae TaxID=192010 RepID=A0A1L7U9S4_FUSMA|nr:uncharacterized protein FMAN_14381 [Fusarium mangiferae]CVL07474.1 uncharacterized protein FMAN_14381 [Fusarium mangiferae]